MTVSVAGRSTAREAGAWLAALPVEVQTVTVETGLAAAAGYPPPGRPTAIVTLTGGGARGHGEHVAWTVEEQAGFRRAAAGWVLHGHGMVGDRVTGAAPAYARAALEGALVDLALRQAGVGLAAACGVAAARCAYVVSFDARPAPARRVADILAATPGARFKVDVSPDWSAAELADLAACGDAIAVLDLKERGDPGLVATLLERFPSALLEDPPALPAGVTRDAAARLVRDRAVLGPRDVVRVAPSVDAELPGGWVNVKVPRVGGVLVALEVAHRALAAGLGIYWGGMFELGPGRVQARALAALFCPEAPNDLAPIPAAETDARRPSPLEVRLDEPGFG